MCRSIASETTLGTCAAVAMGVVLRDVPATADHGDVRNMAPLYYSFNGNELWWLLCLDFFSCLTF